MVAPNRFEELKSALDKLKTFLDDNVGVIKPGIAPLDQMTGGRMSEMITKLVDLMTSLKAEVDKLDPNVVPALSDHTTFTQNIKTLSETSMGLLPDQADTIDEILDVAEIVISLPSIELLREEIKALIDAIIPHLNALKS